MSADSEGVPDEGTRLVRWFRPEKRCETPIFTCSIGNPKKYPYDQ